MPETGKVGVLSRPKSPRLRTRDQITVQYRLHEECLKFWKTVPYKTSNPRLRIVIERNIAQEEAAMDALLYCLNGVV